MTRPASLRLWALEVRHALAAWPVLACAAVVLLAGGWAIVAGRAAVAEQRALLAEVPGHEADQQSWVRSRYDGAKTPVGEALYSLAFTTAREPGPWSALALGQRDVHPQALRVRLLALEGQLYEAELANPRLLLAGHLDLAFVLVFLLPLFVIVLGHDALSSEREQGTWALLRVQAGDAWPPLRRRLLVRALLALGLALGLLMAGALLVRAPLDGRFAAVAGLVTLYVAFWSGVTAWVAAGRGSTAAHALRLTALWVTLTVLAPAGANLAVAAARPIPEALQLTLEQRQGYHGSWDVPRARTMQRFFERYPAHAHHVVPDDRFSWAWYYAMQQMGDDAAAGSAAAYREALRTRERWTALAALALPPVALQRAFDAVARTDLATHLAFLDSVRDYHERLKTFFHPLIFRDVPIDDVAWRALPRHRFGDGAGWPPASAAAALLAAGVVVGAAALSALRRAARRATT